MDKDRVGKDRVVTMERVVRNEWLPWIEWLAVEYRMVMIGGATPELGGVRREHSMSIPSAPAAARRARIFSTELIASSSRPALPAAKQPHRRWSAKGYQKQVSSHVIRWGVLTQGLLDGWVD